MLSFLHAWVYDSHMGGAVLLVTREARQMINFIYDKNFENKLVGVSHKFDETDGICVNRNDMVSFQDAEQIANDANAFFAGTGRVFAAVDAGEWTSPRFDVVEVPKVGDEVSRAFNGDSYPTGTITRVSGKDFRVITTSTGAKFYRRRLSASWIADQTWYLLKGTHNERNPSF